METNYISKLKMGMLLLVLFAGLTEGKAVVHVINATTSLTFDPANLEVKVGDTVRWVNVGTVIHNTIPTSIPAGANPWSYTFTGDGDSFDYVVMASGNYAYDCTIHPGMSGQFSAIVNSIKPFLNKTDFSVFPNPATESITFSYGGKGEMLDLKVMDLTGKYLFRNEFALIENKVTIEIKSLNPGVYFLLIETADGKSIQKIVKRE